MLHQINQPFTSDYFNGIRNLQVQLIELCFNNKDVDEATIRENFPPEVASWLNQNFNKLIGNLNRAVENIPNSTKDEIINVFLSDYAFSESLSNSEFQFREVGNQEVSKLAKWCTNFFTQFTSGIDRCITKNEFINKGVWKQKYKFNNLIVKVCPFCDCYYHKGTISIEHFLPKSIYPFLSVHPTNLIPCCEDCNGAKGDIDPLTNAVLGHTPFPYSFQFDELIDICFDFEKQKFCFIKCGNDDLCFQEFIKVMRDGYKLPQRWNTSNFIDQIIDITYMQVAEKLIADERNGLNPRTNPEFFLEGTLEFIRGRFGRFEQMRLIYAWLLAAYQNDRINTFTNILRYAKPLQRNF